MTNTVTILPDHKGFTKPRANGDEYMVDATILISVYTELGEVITATSLGLSSLTAVTITGTPAGLPIMNYAVQTAADGTYTDGIDTSFKIEINEEDGTTGISAPLATGSTAFAAGHIRVRAYGML